MKFLVPLAAATLTLSLPAAVASATATVEPSSENDIVVTGLRTTADVKKAVAQFIDTSIAVPRGGRHQGQYARFSDAICPLVSGLSKENNSAIEQRMRAVARTADMGVAQQDCTPNVFVAIVKDGPKAVSDLRKKHKNIFGTMPVYQRDQLLKQDGPAFSWKRVDTVTAASGFVHRTEDVVDLPTEQAKTTVSPVYSTVKSKIKTPTMEAMRHSYLVLEQDALIGLTTVQIADYAAMRSYLEVKSGAGAKPAAFSILSLFDSLAADNTPPASISDWDLVLLSSMYGAPSDVSAGLQRSDMQQRFVREITLAVKPEE